MRKGGCGIEGEYALHFLWEVTGADVLGKKWPRSLRGAAMHFSLSTINGAS